MSTTTGDPTPATGPQPPIPVTGGAASARSRLGRERPLPAGFLDGLNQLGLDVVVSAAEVGDASRDWWPLAMIWATNAEVPARAAVLVRPTSVDQISTIYRLCQQANVPVTPCGGRSGVVGASVPVYGGLLAQAVDGADLVHRGGDRKSVV